MRPLLLIDITFHANTEYADTDELIKAQYSSLNYVNVMKHKLSIEVIKHIGNHAMVIKEHPGIKFFRGKNSFFYIPFTTLRYLKHKRPDIILVQGLKFPFQLIALKWLLGKRVKIIAKHHADHPPAWPKSLVQKFADKYTDSYLFTSYGNASEWIETKMISSYDKVMELPATFTAFTKRDKTKSKQKLGMGEGLHYLWVGRLNNNKDPMTILAGFAKYLTPMPGARLHFIYQSDDLLEEMKQFINDHQVLQHSVQLHGYIPYAELPDWYSAADFFISGSHREAGSAGLLEAMACGCIPIVTSIAPAMKVICNGQYGFYFEPGNAGELADILISSQNSIHSDLSAKTETWFNSEYSLPAIAEKLYQLCSTLTGK